MKLISYIDLLAETQLSVSEILKPNSQTGEPRTKILFNAIKKGNELELKDGSKVKINISKSKELLRVLQREDEDEIKSYFGARGSKGKVFTTTDEYGEQQLSLSSFKKTTTFGGGGELSVGAGAEQTILQEGSQCVALAIAVKRGKKSIQASDLTSDNIQKASSLYDIVSSTKDVANFFNDEIWKQSIVSATNAILDQVSDLKQMKFHHQSSWVKQLEKTFTKVNKEEEKYFSNINKWNPSDIWAVRDGIAPPEGDEANTLVELNAWTQDMFEKRDVIGFSLKKTGKTASIKRINYHGDVDELLDISIKKLLVSKSNKLFGSKDAFIIFESLTINISDIVQEKENSIQFRSFSGDESIQGEIKGTYASHGKIGHGPINKILSRMGLKTVTSRKDIYAMRKDSKSKIEKYKPVVEKIIKNARKVNAKIAREASDHLRKISKTIEHNVLISKFQAVELLSIIKKANKEDRETFIQEVIGMASSQTQLSSVFYKVS